MSAAVLSLLVLVTWQFEITAEDIVAAFVLIVLICGCNLVALAQMTALQA